MDICPKQSWQSCWHLLTLSVLLPSSSAPIGPAVSSLWPDLVLQALDQPVQLGAELSGGVTPRPLHRVDGLEAQDGDGLVQETSGVPQLLQEVSVADDVWLVVTPGQVQDDPVHLAQKHASHTEISCNSHVKTTYFWIWLTERMLKIIFE